MSKIIKKGKFFKYIRQAGSKIFLFPNYGKVEFQALQISNKKMKILPLFSFEKLKIYQITNHNHQKIDKGINFFKNQLAEYTIFFQQYRGNIVISCLLFTFTRFKFSSALIGVSLTFSNAYKDTYHVKRDCKCLGSRSETS